MKVQEAVEDYLAASRRNTQSTQAWYKRTLLVFTSWCEAQGLSLEDIRAMHTRKFLQYVENELPNKRTGGRLSSQSVHHYAQIIKGFYNWCGKEDEYEDLVKPNLARKIEMPRVEKRVIETFTTDQLNALYKAAEKECTDELQKRDTAILSVLIDTGIRASELCTLTLDHVCLDRNDPYLLVMGKGRKEREVGLGTRARSDLHKYITRYRGTRRLNERVGGDVAFLGRYGEQLTADGLEQLISRLGRWAMIKGVRCSAHTFRHTYAVRYLQGGGDLYKLSRLMGHSSISTTEIYLRALKNREAREGKSVLDSMF